MSYLVTTKVVRNLILYFKIIIKTFGSKYEENKLKNKNMRSNKQYNLFFNQLKL